MGSSAPHEVLVVSPYFSSHGGEIEDLTERMILEIAARDHFHFTWAASAVGALPDLPEQSVLPLRAVNTLDRFLGLGLPFWPKKALRALTEAMASADLLWLHGTRFPGAKACVRIARQLGRPVVITETEGPAPGRPAGRMDQLWDRLATLPLLRAADRAVFSSDRVAEDYFRRAAFTKPVSVIPYGVDLRLFHRPLMETRRYLRTRFALRADQPVLMYAGPFEKRKGLSVIRALARRLPGWRFWLAGSGTIDPNKWLLPNVHVFSDREGPNLAELYQGADVFLMPAAGPRFPRCIQEAMASGLPVLCAPAIAEGARSAVSHLHLAHVFLDDPDKTAAAWEDYLQNFPLPLPRLVPDDDVADFAADTWDWPPLADAYAEIFRDVRRTKL